jgi:hypothetical protein
VRPIRDLVLSGFLAPLLYQVSHGGFHFGDYQFFGQPLPFANIVVPTPTFAPAWVWAAYALFALALLRFIAAGGAAQGRQWPAGLRAGDAGWGAGHTTSPTCWWATCMR